MIKQLNRTKPKLSSCHLPIGEGEGLAKAEIQISFLSATSAAVEWKGEPPKGMSAVQLKPGETPEVSTARGLMTYLSLFPLH